MLHVPACLRMTRATFTDMRRQSPADRLMPGPCDRWVRCIIIDADPEDVYRWLCQLTVAPYSYDLIDNPGRRSPSQLTPGAEHLRLGQTFLIFELRAFQPGRFIAGRSQPRFRQLYGDITVSYEALARPEGRTLLQANACISHQSSLARRMLLALGDKIMAGKQLRTLKRNAEARAHQ